MPGVDADRPARSTPGILGSSSDIDALLADSVHDATRKSIELADVDQGHTDDDADGDKIIQVVVELPEGKPAFVGSPRGVARLPSPNTMTA